VAFSCLFTFAVAKPGVVAPLAYSSSLVAPAGFGYSSYVASSPLVYSALAAPIAHTVAASVGAAVAPVVGVDKTQYHAQDILGQASYGHSEAFQAHNAVQDAAGNKVGSYSYVAPDGQVISTSYIADSLGYRTVSNALPVGPSVVPLAPSETPEVVAARIAHLKEYEVAKSRSRRSVAVATPVAYSGLGLAYSAPLVHSAAVPVAYSTPVAAVGPALRSATLTTVVNNPGHAVSYRVD
ncbi:hypothetical protein NQ314_002925, partial [Rhamnusium bicolor]